MNELKLFSITTSATWVTEYTGYVLAHDREEALKAAKNVEPDMYDSEHTDTDCFGNEVSLDILFSGKLDYDFLLVPEKRGDGFEEVPFSEFKEMITPEQIEKLRIKMIEKDNGQLDLDFGELL
jgi:hypothetical protein